MGHSQMARYLAVYILVTEGDGHSLFLDRLNHSCVPNVILSSNDNVTVELRALRDIQPGKELEISYVRMSKFATRRERREMLSEWNFTCACPVCCLSGGSLEDNDRTRVRIRENSEKIDRFLKEVATNAIEEKVLESGRLLLKYYSLRYIFGVVRYRYDFFLRILAHMSS